MVSITKSTLFFEIGGKVYSITLNNIDNENGRLGLFHFINWTDALPVDVHQHYIINASNTRPFEAFTQEGSTHIWDFEKNQVIVMGINGTNLTVSMDNYFVCDPNQWLRSTKLYTVYERSSPTTVIWPVWYERVEWITVIVILSFLAIIFCIIGFCQMKKQETSKCVSFFKVSSNNNFFKN